MPAVNIKLFKGFIMYRYIQNLNKILIPSIFILILAGCTGDGGSTSNTTNTIPAGDTNLGVLSNGSLVYSSSANYTTPTDNYVTGTIGLTSGTSGTGYLGILSFVVKNGTIPPGFAISDKMPLITTKPHVCILDSLNLAQTCQLLINGDAANPGTYIVTPTITADGVSQQLNNFMITVTKSGGNTTGSLAINLANSGIMAGESTIATVSLSNSSAVGNVQVNISTTTPQLINIKPNACILSKDQNNCEINIIGKRVGIGEIIASAQQNGAIFFGSKQIAVNSNPGNITMALSTKAITTSESLVLTITLNNAIGTNNVPITVSSSNTEIATITSPSSCTIASSTPPNNSCNVNIIGTSQQGVFGETTITAVRQDIKSNPATDVLRLLRNVFFTTQSSSGDLDGVNGADRKCMDDQHASKGVYKAFLTDGKSRVACTTPYCQTGVAEHSNWVLAPQTSYVFFLNPGVTVVRDTNKLSLFLNESGILENSGNLGVSDFPTSHFEINSFDTPFWTGLNNDYTHIASCSRWTSALSMEVATNGLILNQLNGNLELNQVFSVLNAIDFETGMRCDQSASLMCVEQ